MAETRLCGKNRFTDRPEKNVNEDRPLMSTVKCSSMIVVSRSMRYSLGPPNADIRWVSSWGRGQTTVGLSNSVIFIVCYWPLCPETGYAGYVDIQPFDSFSVLPKCMTLNEPE